MVNDICADILMQTGLSEIMTIALHLSFCRKFLFLTYPIQRKRDLLNPSQRKKQKK